MAKFSKVSPLLPCRHLKPNLLFDVSLHFPPNTPDLGFSPSLLKFGTRSSMLIRVWGPQRGCGIFSLWQELRAVKTLKKIIGLLDYLGKPRSGSRSRQILQQAEVYSHSPQNAELRTKHPDILQETLPSLRKILQRSEEPPPAAAADVCHCFTSSIYLPACHRSCGLPGEWSNCASSLFLPVAEWKVQQMLRWREAKHAPEPKSCTSQGSAKAWREQQQQ